MLRRFEPNRLIAMLLSLILTITSMIAGTVSVSANNSTDTKGDLIDISEVATVMPDGYLISNSTDNLIRLKMDQDNATVTINDSNITKESRSGSTWDLYCWNVTTLDATTLYNPMSVSFTNVGEYNGRSINAELIITQIDFSELYDNGSAAYNRSAVGDKLCLMRIGPSGSFVIWCDNGSGNLTSGSYTLTDGSYFIQPREIALTYTLELTWADDGSDFDYGYYAALRDIDAGHENSTTSFYREAVESKDESCAYYVTNKYNITTRKTSDSTLFISAQETCGSTEDDDSYDVAGAMIATKETIELTNYFASGYCSSAVYFYIDDFESSLTKSESISTYKSYDSATTMSYDVAYAMPEFYVDTFNLYDELSIYDTLPSGVTYTSAKVVNESSNTDITNKGTLKYDSGSNKVTFAFSDDYIKDISNYNGQDIVLTIIETVSGDVSYDNTAYASISGVEVSSNTVTVDPLYKITTEVINGTIDDDVTEIEAGSDETISYSPDSGYTIKSVTVDGTSVNVNTYETSYDFTNITGNHTIKVVYAPASRTITIIKKVLKSDINYSNGTPTFVFHLEGTDVNGDAYSYNQIASMDESLAADSDGYISVSCTFDVAAGTYTSTENLCSRYEFDSTESLTNATASSSTITYDVKTNTSASATYINEITNFGGFSDATSIINNCGSTN
ncbi:MAG: hypothetical protein LUG21_06180 [Clostridiales bacterium]|nr:hypothetical protein [Clostridiales bacterium]